ncbi:MAG: helical backbone metal receptor [Alkaliphilus sp.]
MKRITKILVLTLVAILCLSTMVSANQVNLEMDGSEKALELRVNNARTYVSSNSLDELGFSVTIRSTGVVGTKIVMSNDDVTMKFVTDSNVVEVNEADITIDAVTFIENNVAYVPLRFVLETLGHEISWDAKNRRIVANMRDGIVNQSDEPSTVISMAPSVTEIIFALGAGEKLVGRTQFCDYPSDVAGIQNIGSMFTPDIEQMINIYPDIVIAQTHFKEEILAKFNEAGIKTSASATPASLEQLYDAVLETGMLINRNFEARAVVSSMRAKVQRVEYVLRDVSKGPSVYYVMGTGDWGEWTATKDTFLAEAIAIAGGDNVAAKVEPEISWGFTLEKLIDANPEVIFGSQFNKDKMNAGDQYTALSAIKNNNFKVVDYNIFERPSPRLINEGLKILLEMFHPELEHNLDF